MLTVPTRYTNLFMEPRFLDMSLSSPSYAKTHCELFLNKSQEHCVYGMQKTFKYDSVRVPMVDVTVADVG